MGHVSRWIPSDTEMQLRGSLAARAYQCRDEGFSPAATAAGDEPAPPVYSQLLPLYAGHVILKPTLRMEQRAALATSTTGNWGRLQKGYKQVAEGFASRICHVSGQCEPKTFETESRSLSWSMRLSCKFKTSARLLFQVTLHFLSCSGRSNGVWDILHSQLVS